MLGRGQADQVCLESQKMISNGEGFNNRKEIPKAICSRLRFVFFSRKPKGEERGP